MLLNNFFYIDSISSESEKIMAQIRINPSHEILKGHFPTQPLVPGVCMLEMLKEVIEMHLQKKLMLTESSMIKFLTMFAIPTFEKAFFEIELQLIADFKFKVSASLKHEEHIFLKFKGIYTEKK